MWLDMSIPVAKEEEGRKREDDEREDNLGDSQCPPPVHGKALESGVCVQSPQRQEEEAMVCSSPVERWGERVECLDFSITHSAGCHGNKLTKGEAGASSSLSAVENWNGGRLYPPTAENNMKLETEERFKRGKKNKINVPREQYFCHKCVDRGGASTEVEWLFYQKLCLCPVQDDWVPGYTSVARKPFMLLLFFFVPVSIPTLLYRNQK